MIRPPRATARSVAVAAVTVTTVGVLPVYLVTVLSVQVGADLGFGPAVLGVLAAVFFATSAVAAFSAGTLVRWWGSAVVVRVSAVTSAAAMAAIGLLARDTLTLSAALVVAGWANGVGQPASNALIAGAVPDGRQGLAYGLKQAAIPLATLLAGVGIPLIAVPFGWRWTLGLGALLAIAVAVSVPRGGSIPPAAAAAPSEAAGPFRRMPLLVLSAGLLLAAGTGNALGSFFVLSAVDSGFAPATAGLVAAAAGAAGVVVRVVLGWLADRVRTRWLLVVVGQLVVGAAGFLLLGSGQKALIVGGVVLGYCAGWAWAGLATYSVARMHPGMAARATSITQGGLGLGAALGPLAFGATVAASSYRTAWVGTAALALAAAVVCALGRQLLMRERPGLVAAQRLRRRPPSRV